MAEEEKLIELFSKDDKTGETISVKKTHDEWAVVLMVEIRKALDNVAAAIREQGTNKQS